MSSEKMELQKYNFTSSYTKNNHSKYTVSPTFWGFNIKYDAYVKIKNKIWLSRLFYLEEIWVIINLKYKYNIKH